MALTKPANGIIGMGSLASGNTTALSDCSVIDLTESAMLTVTTKVTYGASASKPVKIHMRSSPEGTADADFDTLDTGGTWEVAVSGGSTVQYTATFPPDYKYLKALVENQDAAIATGSLIVKAVTQEVSPT